MAVRIPLLILALLLGSSTMSSWAAPAAGRGGAGLRSGETATASAVHAVLPTMPDRDPEAPSPVAPAAPSRPADTVTPVRGWAWPAPKPHEVVRGFDPPGVPWGAGHRGVDLGAVIGAPVFSPADGVVTFAGVIAGRSVLVVAHADGLRSTFEPVVATLPVGASIARGQGVGALTASPGHCAPAPCLHWGLLRGAVYLDPLGFLRQPVVLLPIRAPP